MFKFLYVWICVLAFFALAIYTVWLGFNPTSPLLPFGNEYISLSRKDMIKVLSLVWLIAPPLLMYIHWGVFCKRYDLINLELAQHSHYLLRNVWLAVLGAIIVLFGLGIVISS